MAMLVDYLGLSPLGCSPVTLVISYPWSVGYGEEVDG
jgi:hypothetical protein